MNKDRIIKDYQKGKSIRRLAEDHNSNPATVYRLLVKNGVKLRTKSEAQKQALQTGISTHPTEGKQRSDKTKLKISETLEKFWEETDKTEIIERAKERWKNYSETHKKRLRDAAFKGITKARQEGSKLEHALRESLVKEGYRVLMHQKRKVSNEKLEIDLLLPDKNLVIEINGPSHYEPIWGEERFRKQLKADAVKMGLLYTAGYRIIIVRHVKLPVSQNRYAKFLKEIISHIEDKTLKEITINV